MNCYDTEYDVLRPRTFPPFWFGGVTNTLPSMLFPVSSLEHMLVSLSLDLVDANFFLKIRELLTLSYNCYLNITTDNSKLPSDIGIDISDLGTRLRFPPARNVQHLWFQSIHDEAYGNDPHFLMHSLRFAIPSSYLQFQTGSSLTPITFAC
uniref:Uncharacterized protein n=1 Tax=Lactuca sativa TaxID=4236 RepID=A0A9R1VZ00_LACSA|nr:hypothetical protein LSAT_V11C300151850 [Lactuca sativa]